MSKQLQRIGGFTAFNTGNIKNCYSEVKLHSKEYSGGFCGENRGSILNSFSKGKSKKPKDSAGHGFCSKQSGKVSGCFWVCKDKKHQGEQHWSDWANAVSEDDFSSSLPSLTSDWDKDSVWKLSDSDIKLYDKDCPIPEGYSVVEISSKEELESVAAEINSGNAPSQTIYRLKNDIDMGGMLWTPIGLDQNNSFNGFFDGGGHTVKNFRIHTKNNSYAAFFGYLGEDALVCNLKVDCIVSGQGNYSAGFCAVNEGRILGCVSRCSVSSGRYSGGFAAQNNGSIESSIAIGRVTPGLPFSWWVPLAALVVLFALLPAAFGIVHYARGADVFAPVIVDPNARPISPDDESVPEPGETEVTDSSASFVMNADMYVGISNYAGNIGLRCPSWSKKGFVATAVVSGSDLKKNGASHKRDAVIYKSGLINPGMGIDVVTLSKLPDGSKLPSGSYSVTVTFEFFDPETNERAAVTSTAPLDIVVG